MQTLSFCKEKENALIICTFFYQNAKVVVLSHCT